MQGERPFDIAIVGATGFTGQFVAAEAVLVPFRDASRIALVGRNLEKLQKVRDGIVAQTAGSEEAKKVSLIQADVLDAEQCNNFVKQTHAVIHCAGPFRLFGEAVVKSCCASGTSYTDICGEPEFLEDMELKYDDAAKEARCVIVGSCGFDSVPSEIGTWEGLKLLPPGAVSCSVEQYMTVSGVAKNSGNYATYESAVLGFASAGEGNLDRIRRQLKKKRKVPRAEIHPKAPKLKRSTSMFGTWSENVKKWTLPFPGADPSVVRRTQIELSAERKELESGSSSSSSSSSISGSSPTLNSLPYPTQFAAYFTIPKRSVAFKIMWYGMWMKVLSSFGWGRKLLLDHPGFFSNGFFGKRGEYPDERTRKNTTIKVDFVIKGISSERLRENEAKDTVEPDITRRLRIQMQDPGYVATAQIAVATTNAILKSLENDSLPRYGVLTPAIALRNSDVVERLKSRGMEITEVPVEHGDNEYSAIATSG